jgi:hypothetical protein
MHMKIDFTQILPGLDGQPMQDEAGKNVPLSTPCVNALLATPRDEHIEPVEKLARFVLAQKITQAIEPIELTIEEVAKIKDLTGKYMPTLVMGAVWQTLESNGKGE